MERLTIKAMSEIVKTPDDFRLWRGQFLDDFKDAIKYEKVMDYAQAMVSDEPVSNPALQDHHYAHLAGMVEYLCNRTLIKKPKWIFKDKYFLKEPYFSEDAKGKLRLVFLQESPQELKARNYFASANTFYRV